MTIHLKNIYFTYKKRQIILKNISRMERNTFQPEKYDYYLGIQIEGKKMGNNIFIAKNKEDLIKVVKKHILSEYFK